jgi:protein-S-isoprenylcysteine O-methyltransferase Ste14
MVGSVHDRGVTVAGTVRFDTGIPHEAFTAAFFPIVVGALAFAGPSGMQQMWYQVLLSVAFGIGYWWLHENFAPRWWFHVRDRNPVAEYFIRHQLDYAAKAEAELQRRRDRKRRR